MDNNIMLLEAIFNTYTMSWAHRHDSMQLKYNERRFDVF